jgi:chromosome segregation protein
MYISKIEIDNFKSFANKTEIPFLEGFTTVSGPNGSGKSNIIDSILFALGLSTSRTLRAEKLFHLINTHNNRKDASVKVHFAKNLGGETFSVTRKIKKSSNGYISSYYFNDKASTLTDVHDELAKYNISPGCYNVMMQGDVTSIVNVTPVERRKIIDEIAGVADFDRRIEQAKKELETVEERVEKSNIILGEIDTRLVQLEEEKQHALKYQKLKEEKHQHESKLNIARYFEIKNAFERLHESILHANKEKKEEEKKLDELNSRLSAAQEKLKEVSENIKNKGEDEQIEVKKQIETLKGIISRKKDSIAFADKQIKDNESGIKNAIRNIQELKDKIEESNLKIDNKNAEIKAIEKNILTEKENLQNSLEEISGINKSTNEHIERRNSLRKRLENKKDEENAVLKEKITLDEKISRFSRELEESKAKIEEVEKLKTDSVETRNLLETAINELEKELKDYEIVQKNNLYNLDKLKNEISDITYNINTAYRKIAQLEANKRAAEDAGFGRAIDTILKADVEGVHDILAKLGKVDEEYSTALEIAMGGRMRNIVVEDDEVASIAIEILKSSNAGRATFLPLNKMKPRPWGQKAPNDAGVIDFAINLVEFDKIYESAFHYALGDTLIVEDLNVARRFMGKYRMVTLDGSLVEKTGAMTGGSTQKSGLKFAQSEDDELAKFKERLEKMEDKSVNLEKQKRETEQKLDEVRRDYSSAMNELNRKKMELDNLQKMLNDADTTIASRQQKIETLTPQLAEAEKEFTEVTENLNQLKKEIENLSAEIENIESILPKDELAKLNERTTGIELEIKRYESKLANCQNDIKSVELEINFNKITITAQEDKIEKSKEENLKLAKEKEEYAKEITDTETRFAELEVKIAEINKELGGLQEERDKFQSEVLSLESNKNNMKLRIERLIEQVEAFKISRKEKEPELDAIREELIQQGYEIAQLSATAVSVEEVHKAIARLQKRMEDMEPVNMKALTEYDEVKARKDELKDRIETLITEKNQIIDRMNGYEDLKIKSFKETYEQINNNFVGIFSQLSDGTGKIVLDNEENPLAGGLTIEAQPRDKKMQRLESMSGGEKSLTALAFVFAIQRYLPAPFYAFDEVDMHLDGINAEKLASMIKHQATKTQFIVVSLRKPMIEAADRTIGVTQKNNGITKVTGVKLHA